MSAPRWKTKFEVKPGSWVYVPSDETEKEGKRIAKIVRKHWTPPSHFYHLNPGGHVKALQLHMEHRLFASVDLKDFFGSISKSRITRALTGKISYEQARSIAKCSTVPVENKPHSHALPFGFVQSPILASVCLDTSSLGKMLRAINQGQDVKASVYMDDIVLSSDNLASLEECFHAVMDCTRRSAFSVSEKKTQAPKSVITLFNIELCHHSMCITDEKMSDLTLRYWVSGSDLQKEGIISYVRSVNPSQIDIILESSPQEPEHLF